MGRLAPSTLTGRVQRRRLKSETQSAWRHYPNARDCDPHFVSITLQLLDLHNELSASQRQRHPRVHTLSSRMDSSCGGSRNERLLTASPRSPEPSCATSCDVFRRCLAVAGRAGGHCRLQLPQTECPFKYYRSRRQGVLSNSGCNGRHMYRSMVAAKHAGCHAVDLPTTGQISQVSARCQGNAGVALHAFDTCLLATGHGRHRAELETVPHRSTIDCKDIHLSVSLYKPVSC